MVEGNRIKFDFLGKDSMRYENEVEVHPTVFQRMKSFCAGAALVEACCQGSAGRDQRQSEVLWQDSD